MEERHRYKVVCQLDVVMPKAATAQKAGASFDVRVYFRDNGTDSPWAEVAFLDRDNGHKIIDHMNLNDPPSVPWFFGEIVDRGFKLAAERRTGGDGS